ncbi:hypothetical protein ABBQ38_002328 [Trebouxia sp. C0009 RCD-2024]
MTCRTPALQARASALMQPGSRSWPNFSDPPRLCGRPSQPHRPAFRSYRRSAVHFEPIAHSGVTRKEHQRGVRGISKHARQIATSKQCLDEATGVQKGFAWLLHQVAWAAWRNLTTEKAVIYKADLKLKQLVVETAEEVNNAASDAGRVPSGQDFGQQDPLDLQWLLAAGAAKNWSTWVALTAVYLVSLFSIESSAGEGKRAQSMQQLTWFPLGRAQPGWTPAAESQQTYMRELAALDLKQASQFAAFQAFSTSLIWRGIVLVLVYTALHGRGNGAGMESHMAGIQWSFQVGLVALPSWAQSQPILEVVATTAGIEVVVHELLFMTEAWRQPSDDFDEEFLKVAGEAFKQNIESTEGAKAQVSLDTLRAWVPLSGERISQHALVSALLALEVLVTGSLPGAMLTQALGYMLGWQNVRAQQSLGNRADE